MDQIERGVRSGLRLGIRLGFGGLAVLFALLLAYAWLPWWLGPPATLAAGAALLRLLRG